MQRTSSSRNPNIRAMGGVVNSFLVGATTSGIKDRYMREMAASRASRATRIEAIEDHKIDSNGDYITLGETRTHQVIIYNPKTGETNKRKHMSILLPRAVIQDAYRVAQARKAGRSLELKPKSAELIAHEGTHWARQMSGAAERDMIRLQRAWERDPKQLRRDLSVVFGGKMAEQVLRSYPAAQVAAILDGVHEERVADEAAIRAEAGRIVRHSGMTAIRNPQQYMAVVKASAAKVIKGRPVPYQRAVMADISLAEARVRGAQLRGPKKPGILERYADKLSAFSEDVVNRFGQIGSVGPVQAVREGGPYKEQMRRAA